MHTKDSLHFEELLKDGAWDELTLDMKGKASLKLRQPVKRVCVLIFITQSIHYYSLCIM